MKVIFTFIIISLQFAAFSQVVCDWNEKKTYDCDSNSVWNVDVLGNVFLSRKDLIQKYDTVGILKFSQSQKSLGRISSIQTINTMKVIVFSEEQQMICFFDNTVTQTEDCIELSEDFIQNATFVTVSAQPDKIWVYDQLNSKLHLLSIGETNQQQEIDNLRGILNSTQFTQLLERNYQLLLLNPSKGIYVLDLYGSLIEMIDKKDVLKIDADEDNYYFFQEKKLIIRNKKTHQELEVDFPIENARDFIKQGTYYYFKSEHKIKKYELIFK